MKTVTQQLWMIAGAVALLGLTFAGGYYAGSRSQKATAEADNSLTNIDMQRAFGSVKSPVTGSPGHESMTQEPAVMGLSGLVAGLERKVAANPENIDQQLLLAQTYNELDDRAKSLKLLYSIDKQAPRNAQVKITLATVLMSGTDKKELEEASQLFEEVIKLKPEAASMARLYQGEIRVKLNNMRKK